MDDEAVSPVVGVVLMIAIVVVLAGSVFFLINGQLDDTDKLPKIGATKSGSSLLISGVVNGPVAWEDIEVTGCTGVPTGEVAGGQQLTGCSGRVLFTYAGNVIFDTTFE